jgi:hypothetical protein
MSRQIGVTLISTTSEYPACRYCTWLVFTWCVKHEAEVPRDFLSKKNECELFEDGMNET